MTRETPITYAPLSGSQEQQGQGNGRVVRAVHHGTSDSNKQTTGLAVPASIAESAEQHAAEDGYGVGEVYVEHSSGQRINTDVVISEKLRQEYPNLSLTVVPATSNDLLAYASAGNASAVQQKEQHAALGSSHALRQYVPPARRLNNSPGSISLRLVFGKFIYRWKPAEGRDEHEFILYIVDGRDSASPFPITNHYILAPPGKQHIVDELIIASGQWLQELRGEIWVFDQGWWQKSAELWDSVKNASWDNVILDEDMKTGIRADVEGFFNARETYDRLKVPWKRGVIFYGPPGNGKTISIKAMMHTLYERKTDSVPTLYVRSLKSAYGGEYSIGAIFTKARQRAPCYLVFEDLDSLVTDQLRSYFLNEVDGLKSNDGILMLGSTNHLDRLDPGIAKRPSRFDRKYFFPNPDVEQREAYCRFWQGKLKDNDEVEFPDRLCKAIAEITDGFSFAYMQEAFVASLLAIARRDQKIAGGGADRDPLDKYILWKEIKVQVKALKEGLQQEDPETKDESRPSVVVVSQ